MRHHLFITLFLLLPQVLLAQNVALKTDLIHDVLGTPLVGVEFTLSNRFTVGFDLTGAIKPWGKQVRYFSVIPGLRYWLKGRPYSNWFLSFRLMLEQHNITWSDKVYQGNAYAIGLSTGHDFYLSRHWSLELSATGFLTYYAHRKYNVQDAAFPELTKHQRHGWLLMPDLELVFIYILR